jgi:hypothetical protein
MFLGDADGSAGPSRSGTALTAVALLLLLAGLALQILGALGGGWPTYGPALLAVYALPFLAWGVWARRRTRRSKAPWLARRASWVGIPLLVAGLVVDQAATGVTSTSVERMTWSTVRVSATGEASVELRFVDAPEHFVRVTSDSLLSVLRRTGPTEIEAEFEVTRDYGRVRGFRLVRVDGITDVRMQSAGNRCVGPCEGTPW